jgi:hypothetical protein
MADPVGRFNIAFDDPTLTWAPVWTRLDSTPNLVASYTIDRGRQYELDQTDTGRATVEITDRNGILDPTNPAGPYYGKIEPLLQAVVQRWNPVSSAWRTRFRGFVEDYDYVFDPSQRLNKLVVSLVDLFEILAAVELTRPHFGDASTKGEGLGQVKYPSQTMDARVARILAEAGIPASFYVVFTGNVELYKSIYSPGESALVAIQEAVDAEWPGVSNAYVDRLGRLAVHGRLAKFYPAETAANAGAANWDYIEWQAGDGAAVATDAIGQLAHIRSFAFNRGLAKVINSAVATPWAIADEAVEGQHYEDAASKAKYGVRSWSAQSLLTRKGLLDDSSALVETRRFARYYVDNYKTPRNRITEIGFRTMRPGQDGATETWNLLSRIDIADSLKVTIDSPGGGGFTGASFFVEGIHETSRPLNPTYDDVELTLDLSPRAYFTQNPWPDTPP